MQLTSKEPSSFTDMQGDTASLQQLGVQHGDMVSEMYKRKHSLTNMCASSPNSHRHCLFPLLPDGCLICC